MKQYRITVNGKSYDVTVEELSGVRQSPSVHLVQALLLIPHHQLMFSL